MSLAAETRAAVRRRPFLLEGLRAGVVNYTAAARLLDLPGETEAVAAALRRYAAGLPDPTVEDREVRVTMESRLGPVDAGGTPEPPGDREGRESPLLSVGATALVPGAGDLTGVLATGAVDAAALSHVLERCGAEEVDVVAAGVAGEALLVVVGRRDGPDAVRLVEEALSAVPSPAVPTH